MAENEPTSVDAPGSQSARRFLLVTNPESGGGATEAVEEEARRRLPDLTIVRFGGADIERAIRSSVQEGRVVVAAGGDGTVSEVVQHLPEESTLAVLPSGTLNHFARDLGVGDMETAFRVLESGNARTIDLGRAGAGRFVNNVGMGLYPELVRERQGSGGRWRTMLASLAAALRILHRARPLSGSITIDGRTRRLSAWILMIGNNRVSLRPGSLGERDRLDDGLLEVHLMLVGRGAGRLTGPVWRVVRGRLWRSERLVRAEGRRVRVRVDGPPRLVSRDGECVDRTTTLEAEILPKALRVLAP
jgi:diacylglycerol kinase family enzyme